MIETNKKLRFRTYSITALAFTCMLTVMQFIQAHPALGFSWSLFKTKMDEVFKDGLGGEGMQGVGGILLAVGVVAAGISFALHKFNPQSRMPGWISCLVVGLVGSILMGGMEKPMQVLEQFRNWIFTLFGL